MVYDDLIIGSGLTGLAVAYGLPARNRLCVIAGSAQPSVIWYDGSSGIPCANMGVGGLGAYWHGVIPMGQSSAPFEVDGKRFTEFFSYFYQEAIEPKLGTPCLFVPYRPIRPAPHWRRILKERKDITWVQTTTQSIEKKRGIWIVRTAAGDCLARRIWIAAGALGTPTLLYNSPGLAAAARANASDHVIIYLGQLDRRQYPEIQAPKVERSASGVWMPASYDEAGKGLVTTKPARFSYSNLDGGIEQRSVFGLPTSGLLRKLFRAGSLGLVSESLFNKFGLFPHASKLSVYAQIRVEDAYHLHLRQPGLTPNTAKIQESIRNFRASLEWPELEPSRRPELFIHGIHLHHSLDITTLRQSGVLDDVGLVIADPSVIENIGPDHHSFKTMVRAFSIAKSCQI
jgi:hypothetical protein